MLLGRGWQLKERQNPGARESSELQNHVVRLLLTVRALACNF